MFSMLKCLERTSHSSIPMIIYFRLHYQWSFVDGSTIEQKSKFASLHKTYGVAYVRLKGAGGQEEFYQLGFVYRQPCTWSRVQRSVLMVSDSHCTVIAAIIIDQFLFYYIFSLFLWERIQFSPQSILEHKYSNDLGREKGILVLSA